MIGAKDLDTPDLEVCAPSGGDCPRFEIVNEMGLMMLAAGTGSTVTVETLGADAEAAMAALEQLIANRFGEDD